MARRGVKPTDGRKHYPDFPVRAHYRKKPPPPELVPGGTGEETWRAARVLPHSVDWAETDWLTLRQACRLLDKFWAAEEPPVALLTEARRQLDSLGIDSHARDRLGIRYWPEGEDSAPADVQEAWLEIRRKHPKKQTKRKKETTSPDECKATSDANADPASSAGFLASLQADYD